MKIKGELVIWHIAGETVLISTREIALQNTGVISLTESGEMLVKKLQEGCEFDDLVDCLLSEYEVDREQAEQDVARFLDKLKERGLL